MSQPTYFFQIVTVERLVEQGVQDFDPVAEFGTEELVRHA
jgi:hypothetical protein